MSSNRIKGFLDSKSYRILDKVVSITVLGLALFYMFVLIYRQAVDQANYDADMGAYIGTILGLEEELSFPYPVMFKLSEFIYFYLGSVELSIPIAVTLLNGIALFATKAIISKQTDTKLMATLATFCLFFSSMIYSHLFQKIGIPYRYLGVCSPNPIHNPTYAAARPFMILAFVLGAYTMLHYEEDFKKKKFEWETHKYYIYFCLAMLMVTLTKPAYNLPHMAVVFVVAIYRLFKNKFATFRQTVLLACTYIPTVLDLLYQYKEVFAGTDYAGTKEGMALDPFGVWSQYSNNIPVAILLAGLFPLVSVIIHRKELLYSEQYRFSWQIYLAGLLMYMFLSEQGFRYYDGNLSWGYMCGLFLVFFTSIEQWIFDIKKVFEKKVGTVQIILTGVETVLLLGHVVCGVHYFNILFNAGSYW